MNKKCIKCGKVLPIEKFPTNRRMADGHLNSCIECFSQRAGRVTSSAHRISGVNYDSNGKPIYPSLGSKEQLALYHKAYNRWRRKEQAKGKPERVKKTADRKTYHSEYYKEHKQRISKNARVRYLKQKIASLEAELAELTGQKK